jgi:hypothetical protein
MPTKATFPGRVSLPSSSRALVPSALMWERMVHPPTSSLFFLPFPKGICFLRRVYVRFHPLEATVAGNPSTSRTRTVEEPAKWLFSRNVPLGTTGAARRESYLCLRGINTFRWANNPHAAFAVPCVITDDLWRDVNREVDRLVLDRISPISVPQGVQRQGYIWQMLLWTCLGQLAAHLQRREQAL